MNARLNNNKRITRVTFIDLFCGIGGFHHGVTTAATKLGLKAQCAFASDIDPFARKAYEENFGLTPIGDITEQKAEDIPDHDLLCAGFPCQPFSVFGKMRGFEDTRGTLFFEIARIIKAKQPEHFILENVKQLVSHRGGETLTLILKTLSELGYNHNHRVLNARNFGLPQNRERVIIVGQRADLGELDFQWPDQSTSMKSLSELLESEVADRYYASEKIRLARKDKVAGKLNGNGVKGEGPYIYHENKSGNVSVYPYACALRAGSSYNYLLVDGVRRLTEREMLRLQGFPDSFRVNCSYSQTRKQAGNAVPAPMIAAVAERLLSRAPIESQVSA